METEDKYSLGYVISNSIQENENKIKKLEKKVKYLTHKIGILNQEKDCIIAFLECNVQDKKRQLCFDTYTDIELNAKIEAYQEVLDFVRGDKE